MKAQDVLALTAQAYQGLDDRDISEIEVIALDRQHFSRNPV
jgi:hypothetical protein